MHPLLEKLKGKDRRSIGMSHEVVSQVLAQPVLFDILFSGLRESDPVLRMRCADAAEKISAVHPEVLRPHKVTLLYELTLVEQAEVRWHVAQMLPRLEWDRREQTKVCDILTTYLEDQSRIVQTCALQALFDLAQRYVQWRPAVKVQLRKFSVTGSPALKSRVKKLQFQQGSVGSRRQTRSVKPRAGKKRTAL